MALDFSSPFYPYSIVPQANNTLRGAEEIPKRILTYLLDMPDANGYTPVDDNRRPRVRLAKYLWYDNEDPLSMPLPTPAQKLSMLYDPKHPDINTDEEKAKHPNGYRMFWQHVTKQSILEGKTFLKCFISRTFMPRPYITTLGIRFEVWTDTTFETNLVTEVESRTFAIEQALTEALAPINMTGIGAFSFLRYDHASNGSEPVYTDGSIVGRTVHCSINWSDAGAESIEGACETC